MFRNISELIIVMYLIGILSRLTGQPQPQPFLSNNLSEMMTTGAQAQGLPPAFANQAPPLSK